MRATMQYNNRFKLIKIFALLLITFFCTPAIADTARERLLNEYGLQFEVEILKRSSNDGTAYYYVSKVIQDSIAAEAGFEVGHVINNSDLGIRLQHSASRYDLEEHAAKIMVYLDKYGAIYSPRDRLSTILANKKKHTKENSPFQSTTSDMATLPHNAMNNFLGLEIKKDKYTYIASIVPDGYAAKVGLRKGDVLSILRGAGSFNYTPIYNLYNLYRSTQVKGLNAKVVVWRNEENVELDLPYTPRGTQFVAKPIDPRLAKHERVFDLLPDEIREFMVAIFLADYAKAEQAKQHFFETQFQKSTLSLLAPLTGTTKQSLSAIVAKSRMESLFAQYIYIKTAVAGLCDVTPLPIEFTNERYLVWSNQYGYELDRSHIDTTKETIWFPADFANIIISAQETEVFYPWSSQFAEFVQNSGGCNSEFLNTLETNMIAYSKY